jgi:hypothetical protein
VVRVRHDSGKSLSVAGPSTGSAPAISPATASTPPRGGIAFSATGGSGPYTWTLSTNASGATITGSAGAYTAGPTGNVTDVVKVADYLGNAATRKVTVTAGVSIAPPSASTPPGGSIAFVATGGSGAGFTWTLSTNASGGTINGGTGAYTAGRAGGVTDVVKVSDALGNVAEGSVTVTAPGSGSDGGVGTSPGRAALGRCGCSAGPPGLEALLMGALALLRTWQRGRGTHARFRPGRARPRRCSAGPR